MSEQLRTAAQQALEALENSRVFVTTREKIKHPEGTEWYDEAITALRAALEQPERTLTDEVIADLWHANGGFHHHFARAVERWLKGKDHA